ncbi:MAG: hypothetical protein ABIJ21_06725 [Nanoarchaeota archaeon]
MRLETTIIETIEQGCPICLSDVKGNDTYLFFCKGCNILFRRQHLKITEKIKKQ